MTPEQASQHKLVTFAKQNLWESGVTSVPEQFEADFYALPEKDRQLVRAFFLAATTGCSSAFSLGKDPKYGPAYQERRYGSTAAWYRVLKEGILKDNYFGDPVDLIQFGERGHQDTGWVPEDKQRKVQGPSTYEGYTLPRMIIDVLNFSVEQNLDHMAEVAFTLDLIESSPSSLMAIASLAYHMHRLGIKPDVIKATIFDSDYAAELPKAYWRPLFFYVSRMLPDELQYDDRS